MTFTSALIGPTKSNGCQWDGMTCGAGGTQQLVGAVDAALATTNPYVAVAAVLAGPFSAAVEKPDPVGIGEMYSEGRFDRIPLEKRQDTFTPQWAARWYMVKLEPATRLSIRLQDADLQYSDDMGAFDIGYNNLVAALKSQAVYRIPVHRETFKQILFAEISVVPAQ